MTVEELNKIYHSDKWYTDNDRQVFLTAAITGMRIGEVIGLKPEDVKDGYLDVKRNYDAKFKEGKTKTRVNRCVPIPEMYNMLLLGNAGCEWIFERNGKPVPSHTVYMNFVKICESLGIDKIGRNLTIHTLRNFFISYMRGKGIQKSKVKAVVGHADEDSTDWYTYWKADMFTEIYSEQKLLIDAIVS